MSIAYAYFSYFNNARFAEKLSSGDIPCGETQILGLSCNILDILTLQCYDT